MNGFVIVAPYSIDTIRFSDHDIGPVTGMAVWRNNNGFFPNWRLDKVANKKDFKYTQRAT